MPHPSDNFPLAMTIRGKLGKEGDPDPLNVHGIYQMRKMGGMKQPLKMVFYAPTNPQTVPQQANRQKFADAMAEWGTLTEEEKAPYIFRAKKLYMIGYNLYVREYMATH